MIGKILYPADFDCTVLYRMHDLVSRLFIQQSIQLYPNFLLETVNSTEIRRRRTEKGQEGRNIRDERAHRMHPKPLAEVIPVAVLGSLLPFRRIRFDNGADSGDDLEQSA